MKLKLLFITLLCGWLFIPASAQNLVVEDFGTPITRVYVPEIGLNGYQLDE